MDLDHALGLLLGMDDDEYDEEMEAAFLSGRRPNRTGRVPDEHINSSSLYDVDSLVNEVFAPPKTVVPYPDFLVNELKMSFRSNYKFVDSLNAGEAGAINHLRNLANYNKSQLDAYTHLFSWLIENDIEFEAPSAEEYMEELEEATEEMEEVEGGDEEQDGEEAPNEGEQGDNESDNDGDTQDSNNMTKSSKPSNNIQESNGKGQVQKQVADKYKESMEQGEESKAQKPGQAGQQTEKSKKGNSLWNKIKNAIKEAMAPPKSSPEDKKAEQETPEQIQRRKDLQQLSRVFKEIEKDLKIEENDSDGDKTASDQDNERHSVVRPGGRRITTSKAAEIVKEWIDRVAVSGIHMKVAGYEKWDKRKIARYVTTNRTWLLPHAKYDHMPDDLMFMLDFSGSCAWISKTFAQLGHAASKYPHVTVAYGGYEGYVQGFVTPETDPDDIGNQLHRRGFHGLGYGEVSDNEHDVSLAEYLNKNRRIKTVFILGDYDGTQRYVDAYYKHRQVRFVWFLCERYSHYRGYIDLGGLKHHIHYFDGSVEGLARLVNKIKI